MASLLCLSFLLSLSLQPVKVIETKINGALILRQKLSDPFHYVVLAEVHLSFFAWITIITSYLIFLTPVCFFLSRVFQTIGHIPLEFWSQLKAETRILNNETEQKIPVHHMQCNSVLLCETSLVLFLCLSVLFAMYFLWVIKLDVSLYMVHSLWFS